MRLRHRGSGSLTTCSVPRLDDSSHCLLWVSIILMLFRQIVPCHLWNNLGGEVLLVLYRWADWGSERCHDLPRVTALEWRGLGLVFRVCVLQCRAPVLSLCLLRTTGQSRWSVACVVFHRLTPHHDCICWVLHSKKNLLLIFPREGATPHREAPGWSEVRGRARLGTVNSFGLAGCRNYGRRWDMGAVLVVAYLSLGDAGLGNTVVVCIAG